MARPSLTAVPAQRSSLPVLKLRRRLVLGVLGATCVTGLFSGIAWMSAPDLVPSQVAARSDAAVSLATIAANDYVHARDTSVPAATGIETRFAQTNGGAFPAGTDVTFAGSTQTRIGDAKLLTTERAKFYVATPQGDTSAVYEISIQMALTSTGWVLGAEPSIGPARLAAPADVPGYDSLFTGGGDASKLSGLPYGAAVTAQVNRWAAAYAAGAKASPDLFAITGDKNGAHAYDGLGGWSVNHVTVKSFTQGPNAAGSPSGATWMTVRVALVLVPPGANGPTLSTEYDLLLQPEMNPAVPPVTAWGPAGVGPTAQLVNYVNNTNG